MGTVYLAEAGEGVPGIEAGAHVALKLVHPQLVSTPGFFKRFMREAEVGKRIRHENVVRTFDVDATEFEGRTVLFLVMEYVEGGTLRRLLAELGRVPEALLREIALQVSAGLSAIHNAGIVHRDLKPENVLITNDNQVRIMDLGVAKLQEASVAITKEGQFAGSFLYAAPEQFRSEEVGPAVDLYSLGVVLYELATGSNPFRADDAAGVIHAHLSKRPPRATELNSDTSEFAAEVMATLLAKRPQERFESADTLHALLEEGESSVWWHERATQLRQRERMLPPIQVRRETGLHGRARELEILRTAWERARGGEGNTLLVEGEAGIGKTRFIDAFLQEVGQEDVHVLYGAYPPTGGLGGISDAILAKFGSNLQQAVAPYLTVTPSLIPAFAALIRHESPPTGSEPLQGDALHAVCCHLMQALAAEHPTVWVVDDLNFAPQESRNLLLSMARAAGPRRILLILTSRPGLPEEDLAHFGRLPNFKRLTLGRLGARDVVELLSDAFRSKALAEKLGGKIGYKSDGIPFFIFEMVRGLKEGQLLAQQPDGSYVQTQAITDIEVPSAVRDLIEARLRGLSEEERNLLDVAAVNGFEFDPDLVARVCEMRRVKVLQKLAALERHPGVVRASGTAYRFDHNQIHDLIYAALSPGLRQEYHGLLAAAMVEREGLTGAKVAATPGETLYFVAWHGVQGPAPRDALPFLEPALTYLQGSYRQESAARLIDRALAARGLLDDETRLAILLQKSACLGHAEATALLGELLSNARATGDPVMTARVHTRMGARFMAVSRYDEAREHLQEALRLSERADDPILAPLVQLGSVSWYLGEYEQARAYYAEAFAAAEARGDDRALMPAMWGLGLVAWNLGDWQVSRDHLEKLLALARRLGDRSGEYGASVNLGPLYASLGDPGRAEEVLHVAREIARAMGIRSNEGFAIQYLASVQTRLARFDEARRSYEEALALRREIDHRSGVVESLLGLGHLETLQDRGEEARRHFTEAREIADEIGVPGMVALADAHLALLPGGDPVAAAEAFAAHESHLDVVGRMEGRLALWKATGERSHLEKAYRLLCAARDQVPEECRAAMMTVPLHREIVEAFG